MKLTKSNIFSFIKAQFSAFVGGLFDYSVMIICTEFFHIHYTRSIVISGLMGAFVNFSINRYWTFKANQHTSFKNQIFKFYLVVLGSIFLKSSGTFLLTESLGLDYKISRLIIDLIVSLGFNYTLQKFWVFKSKNKMLKKAS